MRLNLRAFAIAVAILWGAAVLLVGLANLVQPAYGVAFLEILASIYPGYHAAGSFGDLLVGFLYALVDGLVAGLVFGLLYNSLAPRPKPPVS